MAADLVRRAQDSPSYIGEVAFKENIDPLSLAVSQTFKIEKAFDRDQLGCTQAVHDVAAPLANGLGIEFQASLSENT